MKKRKRRAVGNNDKGLASWSYPEINMGGPLKSMADKVILGNTGTSIVKSGAKPTAGIMVKGEKIEDKLGPNVNARLDFFENFFSEDNEMPLGRVMVYDNGFPRRYTIVKFAGGDYFKGWLYSEAKYAPIPIKNPSKNLEEYLRFLYSHMAESVEYLEGVTDEEFQAIIKALFVKKRLIINEFEKTDDPIYDIKVRRTVNCLTDEKNALYWLRDDVIPALSPNYLRVLESRYSSFMDGSVNNPDFKSLYAYFREEPYVDMKVLKREDASEDPFHFLKGKKNDCLF